MLLQNKLTLPPHTWLRCSPPGSSSGSPGHPCLQKHMQHRCRNQFEAFKTQAAASCAVEPGSSSGSPARPANHITSRRTPQELHCVLVCIAVSCMCRAALACSSTRGPGSHPCAAQRYKRSTVNQSKPVQRLRTRKLV